MNSFKKCYYSCHPPVVNFFNKFTFKTGVMWQLTCKEFYSWMNSNTRASNVFMWKESFQKHLQAVITSLTSLRYVINRRCDEHWITKYKIIKLFSSHFSQRRSIWKRKTYNLCARISQLHLWINLLFSVGTLTYHKHDLKHLSKVLRKSLCQRECSAVPVASS